MFESPAQLARVAADIFTDITMQERRRSDDTSKPGGLLAALVALNYLFLAQFKLPAHWIILIGLAVVVALVVYCLKSNAVENVLFGHPMNDSTPPAARAIPVLSQAEDPSDRGETSSRH
jgi:uncharacterized membrane protein